MSSQCSRSYRWPVNRAARVSYVGAPVCVRAPCASVPAACHTACVSLPSTTAILLVDRFEQAVKISVLSSSVSSPWPGRTPWPPLALSSRRSSSCLRTGAPPPPPARCGGSGPAAAAPHSQAPAAHTCGNFMTSKHLTPLEVSSAVCLLPHGCCGPHQQVCPGLPDVVFSPCLPPACTERWRV